MIRKNDLVKHETGITATVLKTYIENNTKQQYVQALADIGIIYDKIECFIPLDVLRLRCNNCEGEYYETELNVNENNHMYKCPKCGSSTFTCLTDLEENINY